MQVEQRETLTAFGTERLDWLSNSPFNVITAGSSRGGTSAVAAVMRAIGLNMGSKLHPTHPRGYRLRRSSELFTVRLCRLGASHFR